MAKSLKRPRGWKEERGPKGEKLWVRKVGNYQITFQPTKLVGSIVPLKSSCKKKKEKFHINHKGEMYGGSGWHVESVLEVLYDLQDLVLAHFHKET